MPVSEILDGVDFTLLTHTHFDHYDSVAIHTISKDMRWYMQPYSYYDGSPFWSFLLMVS